MEEPIGRSGILFRDGMHEGARFFVLSMDGGPGPQALFTREDLAHLRTNAAMFDRHSETDVVYDGPRFSARRERRPPMLFGVKLMWSEAGQSHELFFQGSEWDAFLELLDTVCANERAA